MKLNKMVNNYNFEEYQTHNNGGREYTVKIYSNRDRQVEVYHNIFNYENQSESQLLLNTFYPREVFIGCSPRNSMTLFSGGYGPDFDGNSILLEMESEGDIYNYIFIGHEIFSFKTEFKIIDYLSPVGNSDVPYPYGVDENGNYYLLIEDVIVKHSPTLEQEIREGGYDDIYSYYYSNNLITQDMAYHPPQEIPNPYFDEIKEWYIGEQRYTFRWSPNPEEEYDRLIRINERGFDEVMSIVKTNGESVELSRESFIDLNIRFGERYGFTQIKNKIILHQSNL